MKIVYDIDAMREYLPTINISGGLAILDDALVMAQETIVTDTVGDYLPSVKEGTDLYTKLARSISIIAFLSCLHELDLTLSDAGFTVADNQAVMAASKARVDKLAESLGKRLSISLDELTAELWREDHKEWRDVEQAYYLSSGLFPSKKEFIKYIVLRPKEEHADRSWYDYYKFIPTLEDALLNKTANYISLPYAEELQEKIRKCDELTDIEKKVVKKVRHSIASFAYADDTKGKSFAMQARDIMLNNLNSFPTFAGSSQAKAMQDTRVSSKIQNFV